MKKFVFLGVLVTAGAALMYLKGFGSPPFWPQPTKAATEIVTSCGEAPEPGVPYSNECNIPSRDIQAFLTKYGSGWIGEPVSSWSGRDQTFAMAKLVVTPSNPETWVVELANLGRDDLMREGMSPTPGSPPHLALRAWLTDEVAKGTDTERFVGRIISPPVCVRGQCSQWSDKQRFTFPEGAMSADQVQRVPLGEWSVHPRTRTVYVPDPSQDSTVSLPLLVGGALVVGLLLRSRGGGGGRRSPKK